MNKIISQDVLKFLAGLGFEKCDSFYSDDFSFIRNGITFTISVRHDEVSYSYGAMNCGYCFGGSYKDEEISICGIRKFFKYKIVWTDVTLRYFTKDIFDEMINLFKEMGNDDTKFRADLTDWGSIKLMANDGGSEEYPITENMVKENNIYEDNLYKQREENSKYR